jgi:hypothetical protein
MGAWTPRPPEAAGAIGPRRPAECRTPILTRRTLTRRAFAPRTFAWRKFRRRPAGPGGPRGSPQVFRAPPPLFVARARETVARILVFAAGPPVARPLLPRRGSAPVRRYFRALFVLRFPEASTREPLHHRVGVTRLQLPECRRELFLCMRAKCGGLAFEDDRPVVVPGRHTPAIMAALPIRRSARAA